MNHSFNTLIAAELNVNAAIILNNIAYWTERKLANNDVQEDGFAYIYNSVKGWKAIFPYLTDSAIKTALNKLIDAGYLIKRNDLNQVAYDRTNHYAMTPKALEIFNLTIGQKSPMEESEIANELVGNRQPIPVIEPVIEPVIDTNNKNKQKKTKLVKPSGVDDQVWQDFNRQRKSKLTQTALNGIINQAELAGISLNAALTISIERGWQSFQAEWVKPKQPHTSNQQRANYASNEINW
jgi:hypothetical protein